MYYHFTIISNTYSCLYLDNNCVAYIVSSEDYVCCYTAVTDSDLQRALKDLFCEVSYSCSGKGNSAVTAITKLLWNLDNLYSTLLYSDLVFINRTCIPHAGMLVILSNIITILYTMTCIVQIMFIIWVIHAIVSCKW